MGPGPGGDPDLHLVVVVTTPESEKSSSLGQHTKLQEKSRFLEEFTKENTPKPHQKFSAWPPKEFKNLEM